jgi:dTDP-4-amino-4,6-dideoxygalactose transaminase
MGEGGILATADPGLLEYARRSRNYGKPDYAVAGQNQRITEFGAALGVVQVERMPDIVAWKKAYAEKHLDPKFPNRVKFPEGMVSGYYKYIVFDPVEKSTGKVYDQPCHRIMGRDDALPGTDWAAKNHWCVPLYYKGE